MSDNLQEFRNNILEEHKKNVLVNKIEQAILIISTFGDEYEKKKIWGETAQFGLDRLNKETSLNKIDLLFKKHWEKHVHETAISKNKSEWDIETAVSWSPYELGELKKYITRITNFEKSVK